MNTSEVPMHPVDEAAHLVQRARRFIHVLQMALENSGTLSDADEDAVSETIDLTDDLLRDAENVLQLTGANRKRPQ